MLILCSNSVVEKDVRPLNQNIGFMTNKVSKKIRRYISDELADFGITSEQWAVVFTLCRPRDFNQKQLSIELDKDPVTIARILDILSRKGWVERRQSKEDRRAYIIKLTDAGKELVDEVNSSFEKGLYKRIMHGMTKETLNGYIEALGIIDRNLNDLYGGR